VAVGVERLTFIFDCPRWCTTGTRQLAVGTFAGLYTGLLGLYGQRPSGTAGPRAGRGCAARRNLHCTDRNLLRPSATSGWVDVNWRRHWRVSPLFDLRILAMGVAVAFLWLGFGHILWSSSPADPESGKAPAAAN
jgi:hypothetical protein